MPSALLTALVMSPAAAKIKQIRAKNGTACGGNMSGLFYLDVYDSTREKQMNPNKKSGGQRYCDTSLQLVFRALIVLL